MIIKKELAQCDFTKVKMYCSMQTSVTQRTLIHEYSGHSFSSDTWNNLPPAMFVILTSKCKSALAKNEKTAA